MRLYSGDIMKLPVLAAATVGLLLSACATSPGRIQPLSVSPLIYRSKTCDEVAELMAKTDASLQEMVVRQNRARRTDTIGVIMLGLPMGSITGKDREAEVARLKGEKIALEQAAREKGCTAG